MSFAEWRDRAACLGEDPELFFPVGTGPRAAGQVDEAKQVCRDCPVARQCAEFAVANGYEGVWGGLDDLERRRVRAVGRTSTGAAKSVLSMTTSALSRVTPFQGVAPRMRGRTHRRPVRHTGREPTGGIA